MDAEPTELLTSCGRRLTTRRLSVPATPAIERVVLRVDAGDGCCGTLWASLTADEALALAHALITEAGAITGARRVDHHRDGSR